MSTGTLLADMKGGVHESTIWEYEVIIGQRKESFAFTALKSLSNKYLGSLSLIPTTYRTAQDLGILSAAFPILFLLELCRQPKPYCHARTKLGHSLLNQEILDRATAWTGLYDSIGMAGIGDIRANTQVRIKS